MRRYEKFDLIQHRAVTYRQKKEAVQQLLKDNLIALKLYNMRDFYVC